MGLVQFVSEEVRRSRICEYTIEYSDKAKQVESKEELLSAEAHSKMSEIDFKEIFKDKDRLIRWYFSYLSNMKKLDAVSELGQIIKDNNLQCIISLGAGPCVLEHILQSISGEKVKIVATDYDDFMIESADRLLGRDNLIIRKYDFYHDDIKELIKQYHADAVVMFGSACSMDNSRYIYFLGELMMTDIKYVITFEAAIMKNLKSVIRKTMVIISATKRYILKQNSQRKQAMHAYERSERELTGIFRKSGYKYQRMRKLNCYEYAYILTNN